MASRITPARSAALVLAILLAMPSHALAQSGHGLYEPFPEAAVKKRAQRYVERLDRRNPDGERRYSDAQLAAGVFVRPDMRRPALPPATGPGAAASRAGAGDSGSLAPAIQLLLLAALALPAAALVKRGARAA